MRFPVVYSQLVVPQVMVSRPGPDASPLASKPALVASALKAEGYPVDFIEPEATPMEDLNRVHDPRYVKAVLECREDNGFGNRAPEVAASLLYTTGSILTAGKMAMSPNRPRLIAALASGFHHARYARASAFCTFNGLVVAAAALLARGQAKRIAIVDADLHEGDGTDEILDQTGLRANVLHISFGYQFRMPSQADAFILRLATLENELSRFQPELIFYQAGVDAHIDDPMGGFLTAEQMGTRDEMIFALGKKLGAPIVFNLSGGYQLDSDGGLSKVVRLHLNTFSAAIRVYGTGS